MGIDISGLDVTITAGWPLGLAHHFGRLGAPDVQGQMWYFCSCAGDSPLDSFLVHLSDEIFPLSEAAVLDPQNPWVLRDPTVLNSSS